jgi:UrcA family protein
MLMKTFAFAVAALIACPGLATAQPAFEKAVPTATIGYADLNLADPGDARAMLARIRKASADTCRASPGMVGNDTDTLMRLDDCYRRSVRRAVGDLNAPLVTAALQPGAARVLARLP